MKKISTLAVIGLMSCAAAAGEIDVKLHNDYLVRDIKKVELTPSGDVFVTMKTNESKLCGYTVNSDLHSMSMLNGTSWGVVCDAAIRAVISEKEKQYK